MLLFSVCSNSTGVDVFRYAEVSVTSDKYADMNFVYEFVIDTANQMYHNGRPETRQQLS
jgi:hypothetical protein